MSKKPQIVWMVKTPERDFCWWTANETESAAIADYATKDDWKRLKLEGYTCVRVEFRELK